MELEGDTAAWEENFSTPLEGAPALNDECRTPLYGGSNLSRLDTTLMFMNVCRTHKVSNACITELLHLFSKVILPLPNSLPSSEGIATAMVSRLGLRYDTIDACRNECVLYRREYASLESCPKCEAERYKRVGMARVPYKVLRHFPLVPRLKRMFSTPQLARLMTWHAENISTDGNMRGPYFRCNGSTSETRTRSSQPIAETYTWAFARMALTPTHRNGPPILYVLCFC